MKKEKQDPHFALICKTVDELDSRFPSQSDCIDEIWKMVRINKRCAKCKSAKFRHDSGSRKATCKRCNHSCWITAGTIFEHMREPRPYLVALTLAQRGIVFNASILKRVCGIAYSSAWRLYQKIMSLVASAMEEKSVPVCSFEFGAIICKRSLETEARQHPCTEQESLRIEMIRRNQKSVDEQVEEKLAPYKMVPTSAKSTQSKQCKQNSPTPINQFLNEKIIYSLLSDQPVSVDELVVRSKLNVSNVRATLTMLELVQLVNCVSGGRYVQSFSLRDQSVIEDPELQCQINHAINFICATFHGISRRYVQIYLAAYWCFVDRQRWGNDLLFKQCSRVRSQSLVNLQDYVSPLVVQFCSA